MDPDSFPKVPTHPHFPKAPTRDLNYIPETIGKSKSRNPCKECQQFAATLSNLKYITKTYYGTGNNIEFKKSMKIYHEALQTIVQHCIKCADETKEIIDTTSRLGVFKDPQHREQLIRERQNHMRIALRGSEVIDKIDKCFSKMNYESCYLTIINA